MLTFDFIRGVKVGLEYVELDEDDREAFGLPYSFMIVLDLGLIRFTLFSSPIDDDNS